MADAQQIARLKLASRNYKAVLHQRPGMQQKHRDMCNDLCRSQ